MGLEIPLFEQFRHRKLSQQQSPGSQPCRGPIDIYLFGRGNFISRTFAETLVRNESSIAPAGSICAFSIRRLHFSLPSFSHEHATDTSHRIPSNDPAGPAARSCRTRVD